MRLRNVASDSINKRTLEGKSGTECSGAPALAVRGGRHLQPRWLRSYERDEERGSALGKNATREESGWYPSLCGMALRTRRGDGGSNTEDTLSS